MNVQIIRTPARATSRRDILPGEAFFYQSALRIAATLPECLHDNPNEMWGLDPSSGRLTFLHPSVGVTPAPGATLTVEDGHA